MHASVQSWRNAPLGCVFVFGVSVCTSPPVPRTTTASLESGTAKPKRVRGREDSSAITQIWQLRRAPAIPRLPGAGGVHGPSDPLIADRQSAHVAHGCAWRGLGKLSAIQLLRSQVLCLAPPGTERSARHQRSPGGRGMPGALGRPWEMNRRHRGALSTCGGPARPIGLRPVARPRDCGLLRCLTQNNPEQWSDRPPTISHAHAPTPCVRARTHDACFQAAEAVELYVARNTKLR
jgi:hypothetical protein